MHREFQLIRGPEIIAAVLPWTPQMWRPIYCKFHQDTVLTEPEIWLTIHETLLRMYAMLLGQEMWVEHELLSTDSSTCAVCWQLPLGPKWTQPKCFRYTTVSLDTTIWSLHTLDASVIYPLLYIQHHFDGLMQERRNSIGSTLELRFSCINPLILWKKIMSVYLFCLGIDMIESVYVKWEYESTM